MSWEDDLPKTGRGPASYSDSEDDPFAAHGKNQQLKQPISRSSSTKQMTTSEREADMEAIESSPLMQPPINNASVLAASIRTSRELDRSQRGLKETLAQHRAEEQARKLIEQAAHPDHAQEERQAEGPSDVEKLLQRLDRNKKGSKEEQVNKNDSTGLPPLPELSELQKELLSIVSQPEPPQRMMQVQSLPDRLSKWTDDYSAPGGGGRTEDELRARLRLLHKQYLDSRQESANDSKRMWKMQQILHAISVKLASVSSLHDFEQLENQLIAKENSMLKDPTASDFQDPDSYFYDLYTLDLDSYQDIKHLHTSSVIDQVSVGSGWWRTQLSELEEDPGERYRRDLELLKRMQEEVDVDGILQQEDETQPDDPTQADPRHDSKKHRAVLERAVVEFDRLDRGGGGAADPNSGLLLGRRQPHPTSEAELEADLLAADTIPHTAQSKRLTKFQLLARSQGRSYHSLSSNQEVILPEGQRLLRPGEHVVGERTHQLSNVLQEVEEALRENAQNVKKPQRKNN